MKRPANAISDAVIREAREITATGHIIGDWPMADGRHALVIAVPKERDVEIGEKP